MRWFSTRFLTTTTLSGRQPRQKKRRGNEIGPSGLSLSGHLERFRVGTGEADLSVLAFPGMAFCVTLSAMGSKDKGRKEAKKAPKPKPKPEPARREIFTPAPPK
jgi:hypothetical protein